MRNGNIAKGRKCWQESRNTGILWRMLPERESFIKNIAREKKLRRMLPERKSVERVLQEKKNIERMLPERKRYWKNVARKEKCWKNVARKKSIGRMLPESKGLKECCQKRNVWKVLRGGGLPENTPRCCLLCAWQCQSAAERRQDTSQW